MLFWRSQPIPKFSFASTWCVVWGKLFDHPKSSLHPSLQITWQEEKLTVWQQANQPKLAFSPSEKIIVIGDIWLSDRRSLAPYLDLQTSLISNIQSSDLEIVAALWERYGAECLAWLQGMFGLVIWQRDRQQLWLCRDQIGMRTLYYTTGEQNCYIAPQLRTLNACHSQELDLVALSDYLCCAFVPGERTLWQGVKELRTGSYLQLPEWQTHTYWQLQEQIHEQSLEWHGQNLRSLLEKLIPEYLPSDQPVGSFLSGGLDSSCVTALAAKFHSSPIHTYSIHFGADCPNELEFSDLVARHCHTQHHILEISPKTMWANLPVTMAQLDDPIGDPLTVPNFLLGHVAAESVRVVLNGEGGDPCFGGPKNQPMLLNRLYGHTITAQQAESDLLQAYLSSFQKCASQIQQLVQPHVWETVREVDSVFSEDLNSDASYLNRLMMLNIKFKGADHILTKVSNLTQAHQLSGRSPLFDRRVVELSMQIPPQFKLAGAVEKAVLKQAVADLLPEQIINRPKSGMMVPVQLWFREHWQAQAKSLLLSRKAAIASYLNQSLIKEWLSYQGDPWCRYGVKLWLLVSLEIWLQVNRK